MYHCIFAISFFRSTYFQYLIEENATQRYRVAFPDHPEAILGLATLRPTHMLLACNFCNCEMHFNDE